MVRRALARAHDNGEADILRRCFRFRYERTWAEYYAHSALSPQLRGAVARHALGTIAIEIPLILSFFLLLATRPGLPRRPLMLERLNRSRSRSGKARQPTLLASSASAKQLPRGCRSHANGDLDPRQSSRRTSSATGGLVTRSSRFHHIAGRFITAARRLVTFFPVEFLGAYFSGHKRLGHGTPKRRVATTQRRRAPGQTPRVLYAFGRLAACGLLDSDRRLLALRQLPPGQCIFQLGSCALDSCPL
jgi:hypothetical protein